MTLELTFACNDYDRTRRLADGTVRADGISIKHLEMGPGELFQAMAAGADIGLAEMSGATYLNLISRGNDRMIALPVYPSRMFRHSYVFINRRSGIERPEDLAGKRVGSMMWQLTSSLWLRGIFEDDHGVDQASIHWVTGGQDRPGVVERAPLSLPSDITIETIPTTETLSAWLASGDIDALFAPHIPDCFVQGHPDVVRLFTEFRDVERDYYQRTGFFPIMHIVVMQRAIYEANPWAAAALYDAFCTSKQLAHERLKFSGAGSAMVPWLFSEVEQAAELFGDAYWPYGVESNRAEIETMIRYARRQGITVADLTIGELFAPETLELTGT